MRPFAIGALMLGVGAVVGYELYPLTHATADVVHVLPGGNAREVVELNLTPEQMDRLAARIAPAVVARISSSGLNGTKPDPKIAAGQNAALEKTKADQERAFDDATHLVDQMIANRNVTPQGMSEAQQLLAQSGQADRMFELSARVSAAINRGELTAEQAGLRIPH